MDGTALDLDIVVIALLGGSALEACLGQLQPVRKNCCVVLRSDMQTTGHWQTRFPDMKFVDAGHQPVPLRRVLGLQATQRERIAFIEDTCLPVDTWWQAARTVLDDPMVALAGGPVIISPKLDARSTAMACGEYGRYAPSQLHGFSNRVTSVAGNNMVLRRSLIQPLLQKRGGLVEGELLAALLAAGYRLALHPGMQVEYAASDPTNNRLGARFQHGRLYASSRVAGCGLAPRLAWFLKSLPLPLVLGTRGLSHMSALIPPLRWPLVGAWIVVLETAWAIGESAGYLSGRGASLEAWH